MRGSAATIAGFAIRFGARLLFLMMAGRLFGIALFGAFSIAVAVVEFAVAIAGLSSKRLVFKLLNEAEPGRPPAHVVLDLALLTSGAGLLLTAAIMAGVALAPTGLLAPATSAALFLLAPMIGAQALLDLLFAATRWHHAMRYEVVGRSIVEPYAAAAATLLCYAGGLVGTGLVAGYWVGSLAALVHAVFAVRRVFGGLAIRSWRTGARRLLALLAQTAIPTLSDALNALFSRLDVYLVGIFLGESPAGVYGMARQIRIPIRQTRQSFDGMLTPLIARTLASGGIVETGKAAASATRLILAIQLVILVALVAIGRPLLASFGPGFAAGYAAMLVLAAAESIQGAFGVGDLLFLYRKPLITVKITAASILVNIGAGLVLIAPLGVLGAATSVLVANVAAALIRRAALHSSFGVRAALDYNLGPILAAAGASLMVLLIMRVAEPALGLAGNVGACVAGLGLYAAILFGWMTLAGDRLSLAHLRTS